MVTVIYRGGEVTLDGTPTVREVLSQMNNRLPNAKFNLVRNSMGEILKPAIRVTKDAEVVILSVRGQG